MVKDGRRVLLLEFNELNWPVIDRLVDEGRLPTFAKLKREGTWASPESVDRSPHLDPWITWVTVHTGFDRSVHGASVLEQDSATISAKRSWDYVVDAGKSVGVFGSIGAYPPRPVPGFVVPGPFAPGNETFPKYIEPVQALNRKYTQVHHRNAGEDGPLDMVKAGLDLTALGLKPATVMRVLGQLARERVAPHDRWRRVVLQPLLNYDFFAKLYERYRPDFATWHTNHAAHFMHHYWRAWDDATFLAKSSPEEKKKYGEALPYGYEIADELLGRFMRLIDDNTVIVLATSMGQQPYVADLFPEGRIVVRFKDLKKLLDFMGIEGVTELVPTMVPQWNVKIPDAQKRKRAIELLEKANVVGNARPRTFYVEETGEILTLTPGGLDRPNPDLRYFFPDVARANPKGHDLEEFFVCDTPTPKQGMHHPTGVLCLWGNGISRGLEIRDTTNLDILPTMLSLMGIPVPANLPGRVLSEAWDAQSSGDQGNRASIRSAALQA
jgi:hypothetical protein